MSNSVPIWKYLLNVQLAYSTCVMWMWLQIPFAHRFTDKSLHMQPLRAACSTPNQPRELKEVLAVSAFENYERCYLSQLYISETIISSNKTCSTYFNKFCSLFKELLCYSLSIPNQGCRRDCTCKREEEITC